MLLAGLGGLHFLIQQLCQIIHDATQIVFVLEEGVQRTANQILIE